ncbi:MAG TPA: roadblock/LC7 domain-containing protein [Polyangiaceae bacterium]|nr:roadblock/LC7 domain-containing protein [Polyangiaceae bacterium]
MTGVTRALSALRDVAGVHGSFVLQLSGELVGKDLPAVFHDELFVEVGARLSRFVETMAADGDEVSSAILRFEEHRLYVSRFAHGLLAVITGNDVNTAALRMALTLTTRRIEPEMLALLTSPPPPVAPTPSMTPPPVSVAGSHGVPRTYRGRVLSG